MSPNQEIYPVIVGIDILAFSDDRKKKSPIFSAVVLTGRHIDRYEKLNYSRLINKIWDLKPDYIAIDNLFELAPNYKSVVYFMRKIPETTSVVQVTGNPRIGMEKLKVLAKRFLIRGKESPLNFQISPKKLSAVETAEICAYLCQRKVGYEVIAFEDEIKISVTRKKSHGHGGWSAPRYERLSQTAVHNAGNEVIDILKEFELSWEEYKYPSRRIFLVNIDKNLLAHIRPRLNSLITDYVNIRINRVQRSSLDFRPLDINSIPSGQAIKNVILGVDPGTTTGIAVIDFDSKIMFLKSIRECSLSQIVRTASQHGKICLVAADVTPPPSKVEKIAKLTGSKLYYPSNLFSASAKRDFLRNYSDLTLNFRHMDSHEADALFAALKAYNSIKPQIDKINRVVESELPSLKSKIPEIQRKVLLGNSLSNVVELIKRKSIVRVEEEKIKEDSPLIVSLRQEIETLQSKVEILSEEIAILEEEVNFWRNREKKVSLDNRKLKDLLEKKQLNFANEVQRKVRVLVKHEVNRIIQENRHLRKQMRKIKKENEKLRMIENFWVQGQEIPLKAIKQFNESSIDKTDKEFGININDIVLILDPSGGGSHTANILIEMGIRGIVVPFDSPKFSDQALAVFNNNCIPVLRLKIVNFFDKAKNDSGLNILTFEDVYLVRKSVMLEIEKQELLLRKKQRKEQHKRLLEKLNLISHTKKSLDMEALIEDFKKEYIETYKDLNDDYPFIEEETEKEED